MDPAPAIELRDVSHTFGSGPSAVEAIRKVDLVVPAEEIVAVVGPSGCGKSTLLNFAAGLITPTGGECLCFGKRVQGLNTAVAYQTQSDTLLPWRTAVDNAAIPLEIKRTRRRARREAGAAAMARLGLQGFEGSYPHEMSGGMRSRLSLARLLLADASILLFDEPFAALDALLRIKMQSLLLEVWSEQPRTIIYVTHDLNEAIALASRVIVLSRRPAEIVASVDVPFPYPRDPGELPATPEFRDIYEQIWSHLASQIDEDQVRKR